MTENSSIDRRAFVLYDIYQRKTVEESYQNYIKFCNVLGKETIIFSDFEYWFNQYTKEKNERIRGRKTFPKLNLLGCIHSDVINGKSREKSYNDLREAFGNIHERYHNQWYQRFGRQKLPVTFSTLPVDVVMKIVEKCDVKPYHQLRKVSHGIRNIVNQTKPPYREIEIKCKSKDVYVNINRESMHLTDSFWGNFHLSPSVMDDKKYVKTNVASLEHELSHSKLRLNFFRFHMVFDYSQIAYAWIHERNPWHIDWRHDESQVFILNAFREMNMQINVKHCSIKVFNEEYIIEILRNLRPGSLEKLTIENDDRLPSNEGRAVFSSIWLKSVIQKMVTMDQWKQAKHVEIRRIFPFSIEDFIHFTTFETYFQKISVEDFIKMVEALSKSSNFEYCLITTKERLDMNTIKRELNLRQFISARQYRIPDTNILIEFLHDLYEVEIFQFHVL